MEIFLSELKNGNRLASNCSEEISFIIYITSLNEDIITPNDIETASQILYYSIKNINENSYAVVENLLRRNDRKQNITLASSMNDIYTIHIKNKWLFQLILLSCIKHSDIFYANKVIGYDIANFLRFAVTQITKRIFIANPNSVHLLRTLLLILTKHNEILTTSLGLLILKCMYKVALSPIKGFKHYAQSISKITLSALSTEDTNIFLDIDLLPLRSIDMCDVVKLFTKDYINENRNKIINKVLKLFLNNTESKDGGFLYESVLFYSFDEWKVQIWPLFLNGLKHVEHEGEFFQSLLKYWIPLNVSSYKDEFYVFLKDEQIDCKIKAHVLLESRRKGYASSSDVQIKFYNIEMRDLCLRIISTYHKKSLCPSIDEITIVQNYLYSNLSRALEIEQIKSLQLFFSQVFLHAHIFLRKSMENFMFYATIIENIYRYCYRSLKTDFCEVGAQLLLILQNVSKGSHKSLDVPYKIEKKDFYEEGENVLYKELQSRHLWKFDSDILTKELLRCFIQNQGCSAYLTKLLYNHYLNDINTVDVKYLKNIIDKESAAKLQNIEKIKNHSEILLRNIKYRKEASVFLEDMQNSLSTNLDVRLESCCDENIFKNVIILEIVMVAAKNNLEVQISHQVIEKCLDVIDAILQNKFLSGRGYKTTKVLEAFINSLMLCIVQNKDALWISMDKKKVMSHLIGIIQRSNMKRPVSLSVEVLKHLGAKMEETESDRSLKIHFLDEVLKSLYQSPAKQDLKIRRNPESRLVIHAMCSSEKTPNKPLLKWTLNFLLDLISDARSPDSSVAAALHSIEILVSDNNMHGSTLPFIHDIIVHCVELFRKASWIVRNADLQLAKALIERFYGVSINSCDRPKNIEDLFVLFPQLSVYFFKIVSAEELDERAVLVFQFFFEGQIREHVFTQDKIFVEGFLFVFSDIIKKYPNNYGKMAVRSYTSLCTARAIPRVIRDITDFLKSDFGAIRKNIFANFAFLLKQLYDKYANSSLHRKDPREIREINSAIADLLKYLQHFDSPLFSFLLFRIKPTRLVLEEMEALDNGLQDDYEKRLWVHSNIPFVLVNAKPSQIGNVLHKILSLKLLCCMQVKVLSVLVSRFEKNEFNNEVLCDVLNVLFQKSVLVEDNENYLLNCYFKTILLFCEGTDCAFEKQPLSYKYTSNLYKIMIFVLYFSLQKQFVDRQNFYRIAELQYRRSCSTSVSEEVDNDITSTLIYFKLGAPKQFYFNLFKLVFYFSIHSSTYLEAYSFISSCTNKTYCSILAALKEFLSVQNLTTHLGDGNLVAKFLSDVNSYINNAPDEFEDLDGYYSVETDNLVPKLFLKRMLRCGTDNNGT